MNPIILQFLKLVQILLGCIQDNAFVLKPIFVFLHVYDIQLQNYLRSTIIFRVLVEYLSKINLKFKMTTNSNILQNSKFKNQMSMHHASSAGGPGGLQGGSSATGSYGRGPKQGILKQPSAASFRNANRSPSADRSDASYEQISISHSGALDRQRGDYSKTSGFNVNALNPASQSMNLGPARSPSPNMDNLNPYLGQNPGYGGTTRHPDYSGSASANKKADHKAGGLENISEHELQTNQSSVFEASMRDPSKSVERQFIVTDYGGKDGGFTKWLQDECMKRLGYWTEDPNRLLGFWREYVSAYYKEQRELKKANKTFGELGELGVSDFDVSGLGGGDTPGYGSYMKKLDNLHASIRDRQAPSRPFYPAPARSQKAPIQRARTPKSKTRQQTLTGASSKKFAFKFEARYDEFSRCFEYDVAYTITTELNRKQDEKKQKELQREKKAQDKALDQQEERRRQKMRAMFEAYYQVKLEDRCREKAKKQKPRAGSKREKEAVGKSTGKQKEKNKAGKQGEDEDSDDELYASGHASISGSALKGSKTFEDWDKKRMEQEKQDRKKAEKEKKEAAQKEKEAKLGKSRRPQSAAQKQSQPGAEGEAAGRPPTRKEAFAARMKELYGVDKAALHDLQSRLQKEWDAMKSIMEVVSTHKMTNNPANVVKIYCERCTDFPQGVGGQQQLEDLVREFFSDENLMRRLVLYRDEINKSRRRGAVPERAFYKSCLPEDRLYNMFNQPGEAFIDVAAAKRKEREAEERKRLETKATLKRAATIKQVRKEAFGARPGEHSDREGEGKKSIVDKDGHFRLAARPDYTKPKDKWAVGRELQGLAEEFPHDRVLERMVRQEFKDNQTFRHPEEYDVYNAAHEYSLKKNFTDGAIGDPDAKKDNWRKPDFTSEAHKIEQFKAGDGRKQYEQRGEARAELRGERALEDALQRQALAYHGQMAARAKAAKEDDRRAAKGGKQAAAADEDGGAGDKRTLRQRLAANYQELMKDRDLRSYAHKRFPHITYGEAKGQGSKSFPASYKRYFFKLVKGIIIAANGKKTFAKVPPSLVMTVGAREVTAHDPVLVESKNARLQPFRFGAKLKKLRTADPDGWRSRAFKRTDLQKRMTKIFMKPDEAANCTFEPNAGSLHPTWEQACRQYRFGEDVRKGAEPGQFFEKLGANFCNSNPNLYKLGKLKKSKILMRQAEYAQCLSNLQDGFDLCAIYRHFRPAEHKVWFDYRRAQTERAQKRRSVDDERRAGGGPGDSMQRHRTAAPGGASRSPERKAKEEPCDEELELSDDQLQEVKTAFAKYDKSGGRKEIKYAEIDLCMRDLGILLTEIELSEMRRDLEAQRTDRRQCVSFHDFSHCYIKKIRERMNDKDLREAFRILDYDGSGQIDAEELREIMHNISADITEDQIDEMLRQADRDNNGQVDQQEFLLVMKSRSSKTSKIIREMKNYLKKYIAKITLKRQYQKMPKHIVTALDRMKDDREQTLKRDPEKKYVLSEDFENVKFKAMYDDVWEVFDTLLKREAKSAANKEMLAKQQKRLLTAKEHLERQLEHGVDEDELAGNENDDMKSEGIKDYTKVYKTIMCPLKSACPKLKTQRWPASNIRSNAKFGKDCPYAHHPMELEFPQTLKIRLTANKALQNADAMAKKPEFKFGGGLFECTGCGGRCNLCQYKAQAKHMMDKLAGHGGDVEAKLGITDLHEKQKQQKERERTFAAKFGHLKKASVLYFYGRYNDAFMEIAKAVQKIRERRDKDQAVEEERRNNVAKKLRLQDIDLQDYDKIKPEDVTDEFLKSLSQDGQYDIATLKLYIQQVCPLVRNQYDRNIFLNGLIQDLYYRCEDRLMEKNENIKRLNKNVEYTKGIADQIDAMGDDLDGMVNAEGCYLDLYDQNGEPLTNVKRKKKTMCPAIYEKKLYKEEGVEFQQRQSKDLRDLKKLTVTAEKKYEKLDSQWYHVDADYKKHRQYTQDPKTGRTKCVLCTYERTHGKKCPHAHTAIELDLNPYATKIKNLEGVIKAEKQQLEQDKLVEPWKPAAADFKVANLKDYVKPKKKKDDEEDPNKEKKRANILDRANPFRRPFEKE